MKPLKKKVMPKRSFESEEELEESLGAEEEIFFDGFENRIERPKDNDNQKEMYSGKKSCHTDIAMLMSNRSRWIFYVSEYYIGSMNDLGVFLCEFEPGRDWFKKYKMWVDLGFVGLGNYFEVRELMIGHKRKRKSKANPNPKLTEDQKAWNKYISKNRIYVEHAIGGMKRYRVLVDRCRLKCYFLKNKILGVCAGLWNYKLALKNITC
jgi:hypothetical protein